MESIVMPLINCQQSPRVSDFFELFADRLKVEKGNVVGFREQDDETLLAELISQYFSDDEASLVAGSNKLLPIPPGQLCKISKETNNYHSTPDSPPITITTNNETYRINVLTFFNLFADCTLPPKFSQLH